MKINENYARLEESYLFSKINRITAKYQEENPDKKIIRLGIGDVTRPLCPSAVQAMKNAAEELGRAETFRGYGPEQGYDFSAHKNSGLLPKNLRSCFGRG